MPMQSKAQRAYLHIHHPEMAERWEKETPKGDLPEHKGEDMPKDKHMMPNGKMMMGKKHKKMMRRVRYEPKER